MTQKIGFSLDTKELTEGLKKLYTGSVAVQKDVISDIKSRAPGWISKSVAASYGISAKEIRPGSVRNGEKVKQVGTMKISGKSIATASIQYKSGLLTPTHFGMNVRAVTKTVKGTDGKPKKRKVYKITAAIKKGSRKELTPRAFMAATSRKIDSSTEIPFQRRGSARTPIDAIKTVSVPQMIDNDVVRENIGQKLSEGIEKRFANSAKRHLGITPK